MTEKKQITPDQHREQIEAYTKELPAYKKYARALGRVLGDGCKVSFPEAVIQTREKKLSSFAEKVVRKYPKYTDAVHQFTDLCGGRVIVQTLEQVRAVRQFVEANFKILEKDNKETLLGEKEFGYRDMHYIVQLRPDRAEALGFSQNECKKIGQRKAEIQVRTWLQHAWADTLHDRVYKNPLTLPSDLIRTGNLQAALMEEGDRNFDRMASDVDGMLANYASFATKKEVQEEIAIQKLILENEPDESKKPSLALTLSKLFAACGDYEQIVEILSPYEHIQGARRCELIQELGHALCREHAGNPESSEHGRGRQLLAESIEVCCGSACSYAPDLRKKEGLHARALARQAKALETIGGKRKEALEYWSLAHEHEPDNPYYLAGMLFLTGKMNMAAAMSTTLRQAIKICRSHAENGTELPSAYITAGRLNLILGETYEALGYYARAIQYVKAGTHCCPPDLLEREIYALERLLDMDFPANEVQQVLEMIRLAGDILVVESQEAAGPPKAVIIAGGAASYSEETSGPAKPLLEYVLSKCTGTVISGGTKSGIPGLVGDINNELEAQDRKSYELIGYIPHHLPVDAPKHESYDQYVKCGKGGFSSEQVFKSWRDLLEKGIQPHEVICIGFGGGAISGFEYRLALALGAGVYVVHTSGGTADKLIADPLWRSVPNLYPVPSDKATFEVLMTPAQYEFEGETLLEMAQAFHARYVEQSGGRLPENMRPWDKLAGTYKDANLEQAKYAVVILEAHGFKAEPAAGIPVEFSFEGYDDEVEAMAEMEHGRWNIDRLRAGWRPGDTRDNERKINPSIIPWKDLSKEIKGYDREAVLAFPTILAKAGLEISKA